MFYHNTIIEDCKDQLTPGDILVHDSSIGLYTTVKGVPAVLTARNGMTLDSKSVYRTMRLTSGYDFWNPVLAVVRGNR